MILNKIDRDLWFYFSTEERRILGLFHTAYFINFEIMLSELKEETGNGFE